MSLAKEITAQLGGDWKGDYGLVPGPNHSKQDRSVLVRDSDQFPDGVLVHCFSPADDWRSVKDERKRQGILSGRPNLARRHRSLVQRIEIKDRSEEKLRERTFALSIWADTRPLSGTIAESHFAARKLPTPFGVEDLRFHPRCPFGSERAPAIIGLYRDIRSNDACGIIRTRLDGYGVKTGKAMELGRSKHAAVKLSRDDRVCAYLGLAEGIETGLSVMQLEPNLPVWVVGGASKLTTFSVLPGISYLTLAADHDANGVGVTAARIAAERWSDAGRDVRIIYPQQLGDWNDTLKETANVVA